MPLDFIQTQKEVARKEGSRTVDDSWLPDGMVAFYYEDLDTLVATIIANIGRELEARCENSKQELDDTMEGGSHVNLLIKSHNEGIDHTITLIRSITGISPKS
jgi:hypothetical protein